MVLLLCSQLGFELFTVRNDSQPSIRHHRRRIARLVPLLTTLKYDWPKNQTPIFGYPLELLIHYFITFLYRKVFYYLG